jgi:hypothetical protein
VLEVASSFLFLLADRASTDLAAMRRAMRAWDILRHSAPAVRFPKRQGAVHRLPGELAWMTRPV